MTVLSRLGDKKGGAGKFELQWGRQVNQQSVHTQGCEVKGFLQGLRLCGRSVEKHPWGLQNTAKVWECWERRQHESSTC